MVPDEKLSHPMLEIYEQRGNNKKGDVLLSVKQTYRDKTSKTKRTCLSQWEISPQEYTNFTDAVGKSYVEQTEN